MEYTQTYVGVGNLPHIAKWTTSYCDWCTNGRTMATTWALIPWHLTPQSARHTTIHHLAVFVKMSTTKVGVEFNWPHQPLTGQFPKIRRCKQSPICFRWSEVIVSTYIDYHNWTLSNCFIHTLIPLVDDKEGISSLRSQLQGWLTLLEASQTV